MESMNSMGLVQEPVKTKGTGRKKIEIKKLTNKEKRQVTFSKRRNGLMKKASELCILCGTELAIFTLSPMGNKVFSFGHPSADVIVDRYLGGDPTSCTTNTDTMSAAAAVQAAYTYSEAVKSLEMEKKKGLIMESSKRLWELPIEKMELEELEQYMEALQEMDNRVKIKMMMNSMMAEGWPEQAMALNNNNNNGNNLLLPPFPETSFCMEEVDGGLMGNYNFGEYDELLWTC